MKYVKQFLIIISIAFVGELLSAVIHFPIPASIYGIIILFTGLVTHVIPYDSVKDAGHFLVEIMPVMFIPAAVGLMDSMMDIRSSWPAYMVILAVTTIAVMVVSGCVTQLTRKGRQ